MSADLEELLNGNAERGEVSANRIPFLVVLAEVTDPHNLGAIVRSALAAGATGMVIGKRRSAPFTASALKAAAGAAERLPIVVVASIAQAVGELAHRGVWTVGLDPDGDVSISDLEIADRPLALVAGAEGPRIDAPRPAPLRPAVPNSPLRSGRIAERLRRRRARRVRHRRFS